MGGSGSGSGEKSFIRHHWEGWKGFWCDRFAFLEHYNRYANRETPLPRWTDADVDTFIALDPVHGHALKLAREVTKFALAGTAVGAVTTAGWCWKYSRSPHGFRSGVCTLKPCAVLALGAGAVFGWTFGHEIGNHTYQLYRVDPFTAQIRFLEWWESKNEGRS